jgi:hypothetical protein
MEEVAEEAALATRGEEATEGAPEPMEEVAEEAPCHQRLLWRW